MMKRALTVGVLVLGTSACGNGAAPAPDAGPPPPKEPVACFELPGAVRTSLIVGAGGKALYWAERTFEGDSLRYDLVALDVATKKTSVLTKDVGEDVKEAGEGRFVFARPYAEPETTIAFPERRPEDPAVRLYSVKVGSEPVALTPEGTKITSFAADAKAGVVYYGGFQQGRSTGIMKVPVGGGEATKVSDAYVVYGVVDGGASLIVKASGGSSTQLQKIPAAGGPAAWSVTPGPNVQITETAMVYLRNDSKPSTIRSVALSDGKDTIVEGMVQGDLPLWNDSGLVSRSAGEKTTTLQVTGGKLVPRVTLVGGAIHAALPLADGTLAALVTRETDGDGEYCNVLVADRDDESDVCILAPPSAEPLTLPKRTVPKAMVAVVPKLEALLSEPDLKGGKIRFIRTGTLLVIEIPEVGPADPEAMRKRVKEVQKKVTELTGRPEMGVSLRWTKSGKHATSLWSARMSRFIARVGVGELVMGDKETSEVELDSDHPYREHVEIMGDYRRTTITLSCAGKLKNLTKSALAAEVQCDAFSPSRFERSPWTVQRGPTAPASLDPGATGTFKVELPPILDGSMRDHTRVLVGGKEVETLDAKEYDHVREWLSTLDAIRQKIGVLPMVRYQLRQPTLNDDPHHQPAFEQPAGFATMDPKKQDEIAAALQKEVASHFSKHHGAIVPDVGLYDEKGWAGSIEGGKFKKRGN